MQRTFAEHMGNIASELGRAAHWDGQVRSEYRDQSLVRALELIDALLASELTDGQLCELTLFRELVADCAAPTRSYECTIADLQRYCLPFAILARTRQTAQAA